LPLPTHCCRQDLRGLRRGRKEPPGSDGSRPPACLHPPLLLPCTPVARASADEPAGEAPPTIVRPGGAVSRGEEPPPHAVFAGLAKQEGCGGPDRCRWC
jgi:hypothetical protein